MQDIITEDGTVIPFWLYVSTFVLIGLIILIVLYVIFIYIKSKEFHSYSCAYIIILNISILIDSIFRIIPVGDDKTKYKWLQYIQAFILASLDKYILLDLILQVFIIYLGIMKTDFYYKHKKAIFYITFFTGMGLSFLMGGLFLLGDVTDYGLYWYTKDNSIKKIFDNIFNSVFLTLNTFFCIIVIINICIRKEEIEKGMLNENDYEHDLNRMIIIFITNTLIYVESFIIIHDVIKIKGVYIDLIYLVSCLIVTLIYSINKFVINETKKIFCKKVLLKSKPKINTFAQTSTFKEVEMNNRLSDEYGDDN
jgi:hypothetical protein